MKWKEFEPKPSPLTPARLDHEAASLAEWVAGAMNGALILVARAPEWVSPPTVQRDGTLSSLFTTPSGTKLRISVEIVDPGK